jgi:acyl-CoA synthetase (NDP forming)
MPDLAAGLTRLLRPRSIAVVGASPTHPVGLGMLETLGRIGFPGAVYAVHPRYSDVAGVRAWPSVRDLPEVPDAVVIALGAERATAVLEECAEQGVGGAVIIAGGFAEAGMEGRVLQQRLRDAATAAGLALIGPNCMGTVSPASAAALYMARIDAPLPPGRVGLIAESGSVCATLLNNRRGVRFSHAISSGNEAVVAAADLVSFFADDPDTDLVLAFLETIRAPERFFAACDRCAVAGKPVVVLKAGRSPAASDAATAHTGALAYPDRLVDASFRQHGVLRVDTLEELLECAVALPALRPPGPRTAFLSFSGGLNELTLDLTVGSRALQLARFEDTTVERLRELFVPHAPISSPLDAWNLLDFQTGFPACLDLVANDPNVDLIVAVTEAPASYPTSGGHLSHRAGESAIATQARTGKPVALLTPLWGSVNPDLEAMLVQHGIPLLSGLRAATTALDRTIQHSSFEPAPPPIAASPAAVGDAPFAGMPALRLLAEAGLPVVTTREAADAAMAVAAAEEIGYPVVVKAGDPDVLHRTEVGGVALDLRDAADVRRAVERIGPPVLVQAYVSGGQELLLGLQRHPELGPFILLGLGGIWAEVLDDVAVRALPIRAGAGRELIDELRARPLLDGARGGPALDIAALARSVEQLAAFGLRLGPGLAALDVNPLVVLPDGVLALDALVVPG